MGLLLTLRGTPFIYYGDEIGMRDISLARHEILDPPGKYYWPFFKGRDGCRSPMQWDASDHAGFTSGKPWLKVHPNHAARNAASQAAAPNSLFNFTRELIALRRRQPVLRQGELTFLDAPKGVLAYTRQLNGQTLKVYLNFSNRAQPIPPAPTLFSSHTHQPGKLQPYECVILGT
jgi:alpha-glucosidase